MKTLSNHTMIYDADCPLCVAYTGAFLSSGMLDRNGRIPYQQVGGEFVPGMDAERARNEIALVNRETGEVKYGLESLLTVIGSRFGVLASIAGIQPLKFFIQKLYNFISYNRKSIAPSAVRSEDLTARGTDLTPQATNYFDCTPTFKLKYRLAYIVVIWLVTSLTLVEYSHLLSGLIPPTDFTREFLICGGQVIFQAIAITLVTRTKHFDYLGNMMTVSLLGALALLPAILIAKLIPGLSPVLWLGYFMCVVGGMLYEHTRRMKLLELGWWPSVSWVVYRIIVLVIVVVQ